MEEDDFMSLLTTKRVHFRVYLSELNQKVLELDPCLSAKQLAGRRCQLATDVKNVHVLKDEMMRIKLAFLDDIIVNERPV